ncbi:DnaB-like helicase C-terminal domain-containing protein [Streptomyces sp. NPDC087903]|uniref:DnaB-like helicase C-terminal domain-containing protein n=1 Tax=Streptomyces sp. NPDC087903 TaxID=3365819 RepID=UPI003808492E
MHAHNQGSAPRRLATLGDAIGAVLASGPAGGPTFGLPGLDAATGGLQPGRLTLVAAAPNVGGSLLGLAAARQTALVDNHRVLYAASGPNQADIMRRIISAETGGDYPRLKQGRLTEHEQQVAQELVQAPLLIDDGSELTAEAIAETAPYVQGLALVVVDRLQACGRGPTAPGTAPRGRAPTAPRGPGGWAGPVPCACHRCGSDRLSAGRRSPRGRRGRT